MGNTESITQNNNRIPDPFTYFHHNNCINKKESTKMVYTVQFIYCDSDGYPCYQLQCIHDTYETAYACAKYNSQFIDKNEDRLKDSKLDENCIYYGTLNDDYDFEHYGFLIQKIELSN